MSRKPSRRRRGYSRREQKKEETHQRLLEIAWQLFCEKGYEHTTVQDITDAANVAKGTFFNYFETKQAIIDEIALWRIEMLGARVLAADNMPGSAVARVKLVMKAMHDEFPPDQEFNMQLFSARISAPIQHESAHRLGSIMYELVVQAQTEHEIRDDMDPALVTRLFMTCFFFDMVGRHHDNHSGPARQDADLDRSAIGDRVFKFVNALMSGLGGPEWRQV
jgi:AcrR family transcriptional regulator